MKIKRVTGIFILFVSGLFAMLEILSITLFIEEQIDKAENDTYSLVLIVGILASAIIIFILAKLGLHLIDSSADTNSIDQIGK